MKMREFKVGDEILYTGKIYTARDQAHKRLVEALRKGKKLPIELRDQIIYYCGPTKTPKGKVIGTSTSLSTDGERSRTIGSCGPTTSSRMDEFVPPLLRAGLKGMIGKGSRSEEVIRAIKKYKVVYYITYSGCGALLSKYVLKKRLVAYPDLGPEAIYELEVKDFPLIVAVDSKGRNIYKQERRPKG